MATKYVSDFVKQMKELDLRAKKQNRILWLSTNGLNRNTYVKSKHGEILNNITLK